MNHYCEVLVELYKRGDYSEMPLFQKQLHTLQLLEDDITNEILYGGAARGGKSVLGCEWQLMRRLSMPESFGLIGREEYSKLRDTTLLTFFQILKKYGLKKDIDYKSSGIPITIEFNNGSRIFFREIKYIPSDPEFDRLGSYDLTDAFLDEAQQIHHKATQVLKGRFSVTEGDGWKTIPKVLYTCNPAKTWIYSDFVLPYNNNELEERKQFIRALPSDNPHVPESYFVNLRTADKTTRERLLEGNFEYDDDPSRLVEYDAICDMFTNDHVISGDKHISTDLAMQGRDRFISGYWEGLRCIIDIDKPKSDGKDIELSLKEQKISRGVGNSRIVADADGLGNYLESYIKNIVTFRGGSKPKDTKEYYNLKSECAWILANKINNRDIYIKCNKNQEEEIKKEVSMCLKRDNLDKDEQKKKLISKEKMKELLGHSPDYLDMLLMGMYFERKKKKSIR